MIAQVLDHLWQSTVVLSLAALLSMLLRKNRPKERYWVWFAASAKFLIPLSLFSALISRPHLLPPVGAELSAPTLQLARLSQPFLQGDWLSNAATVTSAHLPVIDISTILLSIWAAGFVALLSLWLIRWRATLRALASAKPVSLQAPLPLRESPGVTEPGLVGIWKPVILVPEGFAQSLTTAEIKSILAHEICHFRRKDNLTAALQLIVEAVFWFYPPIWWLRARLLEERELACDEAVLSDGNDAQVYAEGILKICRFFRQPAVSYGAGVSGGSLNRRVTFIMSGQVGIPAGVAKKCVAALSIVAVLFGMICLGGVFAEMAGAQASDWAVQTPEEHARLLAEQTMPQKQVPFNTVDFDEFVGYYRFGDPVTFAHIYRDGDRLETQLTAQPPVQVFAEGPTEFFATLVAAQWTFVIGPDGNVTEAILHQGGYLRPWIKSSKAANDEFEANLQLRIKENKPSPGTADAIRRQIDAEEKTGHALYSEMGPLLAAAAHEQEQQARANFLARGPLQSLTFSKVLPNGANDYLAVFAQGQVEVIITPLSDDGKIAGLLFRNIP